MGFRNLCLDLLRAITMPNGCVNYANVHSVTIALAQDGKPVDLRTIPFNRSIEMVRPRAANALVERGVNAKSRVLLELERRRLVKEDERLATKFLNALRPSP
jgi:hypothetical protein